MVLTACRAFSVNPDRQTDRQQTDGRTDGLAINYRALHCCAPDARYHTTASSIPVHIAHVPFARQKFR